MTVNSQLHLPDLTIQGFRGIDQLSIPRLGRVTLLAGRNGVGKTTVLDAIQVYASRGDYSTLYSLLQNREELAVATNEDGDTRFLPDCRALFYGRDVPQNASISIGPSDVEDHLTIETATLIDEPIDAFGPIASTQALQAVYRSNEEILPWPASPNESITIQRYAAAFRREARKFRAEEPPSTIGCEFLGPGLLNNNDLARLWDGVALTDDEGRVVDALRLVFGSSIDGVAVIGDHQADGRNVGRRAMVKLKGQHTRPVPLKSLGDGALRLFGVALALANSRGGFLLIDEAENGIHHSIQRDYWRMVLQTAHENNVQVLATTHSWDCVAGFAQAATELEDVEGVLVRLSRSNGDLRAVEYPEEELAIAAEQGIEVR